MGVISDSVRVVLQENVEKIDGALEQGFFSEEFRRKDYYDSEVCPSKWKEAIQYVVLNGFNPIEVIKKYGKRNLDLSKDKLEKIIMVSNVVEKTNKELGNKHKISINFPMKKVYFNTIFPYEQSRKGFENIRDGEVIKIDNYRVVFSLDDRIDGFSFLFGAGSFNSGIETAFESQEYPKINIYGILDGLFNSDEKYFLKLGKLDIEDFKPIATRRFSYVFGSPPAKDKDITNALVKLNKFPKTFSRGWDDRYGIKYELVERDLEQLDAPRAVRLLYDEANLAKERGLFASVKVYEMKSEEYKIPNKDPVIVGIDHFGNKFPIIYWGGDENPMKSNKFTTPNPQ